MKNNINNKKGGFIQIIILIIVILIVMKYFGITIPDIFEWIAGLFHWVADFLRGLF